MSFTAHHLTLSVYELTANFPREELFGLRTQLRKTCFDIPAYIAEGCGKPNDAEFAKSLAVAISLAHRLEYYVLISKDLGMLAEPEYLVLTTEIVEVKKMLSVLMQRLR